MRAEAQTASRRIQPAPLGIQHSNPIGTLSLLTAVSGAIACRVLTYLGIVAANSWLPIVSAGFDAAMVGGLADWFAVTALFRHPLGLPIPHTAIIPNRRAKIIESIVSMVQDEWLSPSVISARLARFSPSETVVDWLSDAEHVRRLGAPLRDVLRGLGATLTATEVVEFAERAVQRQLREVPIDATAGRWLMRAVNSEGTAAAFQSAALSLANLARQPRTAQNLETWLQRAAQQLHSEGKRLVPLLLRRKMVQRKLVEAACDYAALELSSAAADPEHRLRSWVFGAVQQFGERLASGDAEALAQVERLRSAVVEGLEARPLVRDLLGRLRAQLEQDLADPNGYLADLVDRQLHSGIVELLVDPAHRDTFDRWVRSTAEDLVRRHHHQIGLTVRENLEALETGALVAQIEARVGSDLQFIRLNGALVGGLIGVLLALLHHVLG